eukprot:ctg_807.g428
MYASRGVGLAAPQVGVNQRLMVFNPTGNERSWVSEVALVNPRIVARGPSAGAEAEGCLSFPGVIGAVERRKWVKVEARRLNRIRSPGRRAVYRPHERGGVGEEPRGAGSTDTEYGATRAGVVKVSGRKRDVVLSFGHGVRGGRTPAASPPATPPG